MESPVPGRPNRETGLPPGVEVGPLGKRFVAYLINLSVPLVVSIMLLLLLPASSGALRATLLVIGSAAIIGWIILLWYLLAVRAASPGLRAMKLQLVGFLDGRPIGWARVCVRTLVFWALCVTGIGLLIMLIMELRHPRKQGWHDLTATAVMIKERVLAPAAQPTRAVGAVQQDQPAQLSNGSQQLQPNGARAPMPPRYGGGEPYGSPGSPVPPGQLTPPPDQLTAPPGYPAGSTPYAPAGAPQGTPRAGYGGNEYATPYPGASYGPQQRGSGNEMYAPGQQASPVSQSPNGGTPSGGVPAYEEKQQASASESEDHTAVAPRSPYVQDWSILLDDGRRIALDGLVLLGRNPQPKAGEEDAQLIKIADETRTVSKSHLAVGVDAGGVYVVDRGSTNGSTVSTTNGMSARCKAGEMVRVGEGAIVSIGDHWLEITRGS
jgi:RDD family/FHA domain